MSELTKEEIGLLLKLVESKISKCNFVVADTNGKYNDEIKNKAQKSIETYRGLLDKLNRMVD